MRNNVKEGLKKNSVVPLFYPEDVHVWIFGIGSSEDYVKYFIPFLSDEEVSRSRRFVFNRDKSAFIVARGVLRYLAAAYLRTEPEKISFDYNNYGKPQIKGGNLKFNISHSSAYAAAAFTLNNELGIDIEKKTNSAGLDETAADYFSTREKYAYFSAPKYLRVELFYRYWTMKEAFVKAVGDGLSFPLKEFDVYLEDEDNTELTIHGNPGESGMWTLRNLKVLKNYSCALAVRSKMVRVFHKSIELTDIVEKHELKFDKTLTIN